MVKDLLTPDYIFEASWEVCNKVGGIYTVLSTRANTLQTNFRDKLFFIGPDVWQGKDNPLFIESDNLCAAWKEHALKKDDLSVRVGRWNIPGEPIVILVDFQPFLRKRMKSILKCGITFKSIHCMLTAIMTKHPCFRMLPEKWWKASIATT